MNKIDFLFHIHRAQSGLFRDYSEGNVPYIGNGLSNNAVVGLISPKPTDRVFTEASVVVSAFCEATVQVPPFVACGRAGNGLLVLEPKAPMEIKQLAYTAAYINLALCWRFNWYRQTTAGRLKSLLVINETPADLDYSIKSALPMAGFTKTENWTPQLSFHMLGDLYEITAGDFHNLSKLDPGLIPVVSCGDSNNGVAGRYDVQSHIYKNRLTIAFNGKNTLTAKYHPYLFAAKDDVAVCHPRNPLRLTTEIFLQTMINRERWRYSYYRKCFADKLRRFSIALPTRNGMIDEDLMETVVRASP